MAARCMVAPLGLQKRCTVYIKCTFYSDTVKYEIGLQSVYLAQTLCI